MAASANQNSWQEDPAQIIFLTNKTKNNYILELPTGRYRLDAGRRMRTLRSILKVRQIQELVDQGNLVIG